MGKKLGVALIVYGFINLFASVVMLFTLNAMITMIGIGGIVWSAIFISVGWWSRSRAIKQEHRDKQLDIQTDALERMKKRLEEDDEKRHL